MPPRPIRFTSLALLLLSATPAIRAQAPAARSDVTPVEAAPGAPGVQPVAAATRIEAAERPVIDGDLSDAVWARAAVIDTFYQVEPTAYATPSERTEIRLLYDRERLYVSIHCFDSDPQHITATVKARDGMMPRDDFVRLMLDPQTTRRDAYAFEINPLGGRTDALMQNNGTFLPNWNVIWQGQARRVADGWTAEMAIPFRVLSFDPARTSWGFDFIRQIKRKSETIRFAPTASSVAMNDISLEGTLVGLEGLSQGKGLDIQLYGRAHYYSDWPADNRTTTLEPSATAYYKITPALTGTLTFNPDFSDTPLDTRRVNTTRFTLFDAETRDFFLQDASAFEFGGRGFSVSTNAQPFFSRTIGLVNGVPVGVDWGGKLSGEVGGLRLGALTARTKQAGPLQAQTLSVARLATHVLGESSLGMILTNGDPTGATRNTVAGADFQYRNSNVRRGQRLLTDVYYERSFSSALHQDDAFGGAFVYPNEPWFVDFYAKQVGAGFRPALGFVNRTNAREYNSKETRRTRVNGAVVRWFEYGMLHDTASDLHNRFFTWRGIARGTVMSDAGDQVNLDFIRHFERLDAPFTLPGGIILPTGRYTWNNLNPRLDTSAARPLFVSWSVECCRFYDGPYYSNDLQVNYRPNGTYDISLHHVLNHIDLPGGAENIHVGALELGVQFTPDMQLRTQVQYDNISRRFRMLVRYKWEPVPGTELFALLGEDALASSPLLDSRYYSQRTEVLLRVGHRLQY